MLARILKRFTSEVVLLGSDWEHITLTYHSDILENTVAILESLSERFSVGEGLLELLAATDATKWLIKLLHVKGVATSLQERIFGYLSYGTALMDAEDVKTVLEFCNVFLSNPGATDLTAIYRLLKKLAAAHTLALVTTGSQSGLKFAEKENIGWNPEDSVFEENSMDITEETSEAKAILADLDREEVGKEDRNGNEDETAADEADADQDVGDDAKEGGDDDEEADEMVLEDDEEDVAAALLEVYGVRDALHVVSMVSCCGILAKHPPRSSREPTLSKF